jgi:hypothetical protein
MSKLASILILIILSILAVFFLREFHIALHWIAEAHQYLLNKLVLIIPGDQTGRIIRTSMALIIIALVFALIPAFIYWLFRRRMMPEYLTVVWVIWFVLITILAYK